MSNHLIQHDLHQELLKLAEDAKQHVTANPVASQNELPATVDTTTENE